ncbi:MAG: ArsR/SmtB family transcription factor [Haloarculaceae archaeon]
MSKEWKPETVFDVLASDVARHILVAASDEPMSADELAEACDTSLPTVYRRVDVLEEYDFLAADRVLDAKGNHYKTFETTLERIAFDVDAEGFTVDTERRSGLIGRFEEFWTDLGESGTTTEGDE